jgi:hypothetical protein
MVGGGGLYLPGAPPASPCLLYPLSSPLYPLLTLLTAHWWAVYPSFEVGCVLVVDERDSDALTCRVWRSFKLRPFSIAISIFIVAYVMAVLKS